MISQEGSEKVVASVSSVCGLKLSILGGAELPVSAAISCGDDGVIGIDWH